MSRIVLLQADLDGISPAILINHFEIPYDDLVVNGYEVFEDNEQISYFLSFDEIWFVDFAPDERMTERLLNEYSGHWKVFDHHESRIELKELPPSPNYEIHIDLNEVGTSLFFREYLRKRYKRIKPIVRRFVELVKTYDSWDRENPDWEEALDLNRLCYRQYDFNQVNRFEAFSPFIRKQTRKLSLMNHWMWTKKERELIEATKDRERQVLEESRKKLQIRTDSHGVTFGVFDAKSKISLTCASLLDENPSLKYLIALNTWGGQMGKLSFRSRDEDEFNLHDLCFAAGHTVASGAEIEGDLAVRLYNGEYNSILYREDVAEETPIKEKFEKT